MHSSRVTKAVIPAAGLGTRFLPVTKVVPKELLPLAGKPVIHWLVDEARAAGVTEFTIVLSAGKNAIREYFRPNSELSESLRTVGKGGLLAELDELIESCSFTYVQQEEPKGLGDAVYCAREAVAGDPFFVLLGDAPILADTPVCCQLQQTFAVDQGSVIGLRQVPPEMTSRYGIVAGDEVRDGVLRLTGLVEKPDRAEAPSNLAISGRYLFDPAIFTYLEDQAVGIGDEIQLTDAAARLLEHAPISGCIYQGTRYDVGDPAGYFEAQQAYQDRYGDK